MQVYIAVFNSVYRILRPFIYHIFLSYGGSLLLGVLLVFSLPNQRLQPLHTDYHGFGTPICVQENYQQPQFFYINPVCAAPSYAAAQY